MLHCQFLCHVLKALFFIKIALKLSYFFKKVQNFRALAAPPQTPVPPAARGFAPRPPASDSWGIRPQTPIGLWRLGAPPPRLSKQSPIANFWLRAWSRKRHVLSMQNCYRYFVSDYDMKQCVKTVFQRPAISNLRGTLNILRSQSVAQLG